MMKFTDNKSLEKRFKLETTAFKDTLRRCGYEPTVENIFQKSGLYCYQVFCYLGGGEGVEFIFPLEKANRSGNKELLKILDVCKN